jgi:hypothetical protein
VRERWVIPTAVRRSLMPRLGRVLEEPTAGHREVISAAKAILAASKINLENVSATIKAERHAVLDPRIDGLEQRLGPGAWKK